MVFFCLSSFICFMKKSQMVMTLAKEGEFACLFPIILVIITIGNIICIS